MDVARIKEVGELQEGVGNRYEIGCLNCMPEYGEE